MTQNLRQRPAYHHSDERERVAVVDEEGETVEECGRHRLFDLRGAWAAEQALQARGLQWEMKD